MSEGKPGLRSATDDERAALQTLAHAARVALLEVWESEGFATFRETHTMTSALVSVLTGLLGELIGLMWAKNSYPPALLPRARKKLLLDAYRNVREVAHLRLLWHGRPDAADDEPPPFVHPDPKTVM